MNTLKMNTKTELRKKISFFSYNDDKINAKFAFFFCYHCYHSSFIDSKFHFEFISKGKQIFK